MRRLVYVLAAIALLVGGAAHAEEFFISHWCGPTEITAERFKEVADCNFTVAWIEGTTEQVKKGLELCKTYGMKGLVIDSRIMAKASTDKDFASNLDSVIADYSGYPALWGYHVADEPGAGAFPQLAAVNKYLLSKDPKHVPFINLYPTYAPLWALGTNSYEEHVDLYLNSVQPRLLSYDHYALFAGVERGDYFENMEIIRRQGLKHHTPFNYILLSVPHGAYRDPSEADLRWQVNTALAYGARGIMYFTYRTVLGTPWDFHNAILDAEGKKTPKYEQAKQINAEVLKLAPTLLRLTSEAVYHTKPVPSGAVEIPADCIVSRIEGGEFVVGLFRADNGDRYAMFVNRSPRKAADATIVFSQRVALWEVDRLSGKKRPVEVSGHAQGSAWSVHFEPGEGRLVRVGV